MIDNSCRFASIVTLAVLACGTPAAHQRPLEVLILGGKVLDGAGNPWVRADVGVRDDRIVFVGQATGAEARDTVDASGLIVAPGFWDVHSHAGLETEHGGPRYRSSIRGLPRWF